MNTTLLPTLEELDYLRSEEYKNSISNLIDPRIVGTIGASPLFYKQKEDENLIRSIPTDKLVELIQTDKKRSDVTLNRIVCAANRAKGSPTILGPRHWDDTMRRQYDMIDENLRFGAEQPGLPPHHEYEEGFLDKHGDFRTRQEAWHIALAAGQIIRLCGGNESKGGTLYSENLY